MLATELGMQPLAARCHLGLGTLLRRSGDAREASEHLGAAVAMFEAMEMPRARERALAPPGA
jgi:threonine/homoserine/homoserine lactone efflux protein